MDSLTLLLMILAFSVIVIAIAVGADITFAYVHDKRVDAKVRRESHLHRRTTA